MDADIGDNIAERQALLPSPVVSDSKGPAWKAQARSNGLNIWHLAISFVSGVLACFLTQYAVCGLNCFSDEDSVLSSSSVRQNLAPSWAGSSEIHHFPPPSPTNVFPSLFPTNVGYPGGTPTGAEPGVVATAPSYPLHTAGPAHLVPPHSLGKGKFSDSNIFRKWGNLSPWYSVNSFGLDSDPGVPKTCRVTAFHLLHRHGARYPTAWSSYGGPAGLADRLHKAASNWTASGELEFLNEWRYKLGEEVLTPFGRQQLYDLGVSMRLKYGFLLKNFTETNTIPVFRTESQDRMLASAQNFAIGFFGYPFEGQYQQSITIEHPGFNNTLAPYDTCPNSRDKLKSERGLYYVKKWNTIYLKDARARLQARLKGYDLTIEDVYVMQQMCAYETVAVGYSKFCELFTEDEWDGFDYSLDLYFWYGSAFGSPVARVQGTGYVQELVARLTHTPIEDHIFSTNATLDDSPITFPLGQSIYVDATHEVVVLNVITALNLSNFASEGPLPFDHIPEKRPFRSSELAPFATNIQFQLLACSSVPDPQIRVIINDGVVPLTGIGGCPNHADGMCPVKTFVKAQQELISKVDWHHDCHGDWSVPEGPTWETVTGDAPR